MESSAGIFNILNQKSEFLIKYKNTKKFVDKDKQTILPSQFTAMS